MAFSVDRLELLEALKRVGKAKRAPRGATSSGLTVGAFVPRLGGIKVEMPGGSTFVRTLDGSLRDEVEFLAVKMAPIKKVLATFGRDRLSVEITVEQSQIVFKCGSFKASVPRTKT